MSSSNPAPFLVDPIGCTRDQRCLAGKDHPGDCVLYIVQPWSGLPDPHRHNPFGVAAVLATALVGYTLVAGLVVAWIFGWIS